MGMPPKGEADYLAPGDFNAVCSMCGHKRKASMLVKNWQGMYRCPEHNEERQPQDFARGVAEHTEVPFTQPPERVFIYTCSINTQAGLPDLGTADCMLPDNAHYDPYGI